MSSPKYIDWDTKWNKLWEDEQTNQLVVDKDLMDGLAAEAKSQGYHLLRKGDQLKYQTYDKGDEQRVGLAVYRNGKKIVEDPFLKIAFAAASKGQWNKFTQSSATFHSENNALKGNTKQEFVVHAIPDNEESKDVMESLAKTLWPDGNGGYWDALEKSPKHPYLVKEKKKNKKFNISSCIKSLRDKYSNPLNWNTVGGFTFPGAPRETETADNGMKHIKFSNKVANQRLKVGEKVIRPEEGSTFGSDETVEFYEREQRRPTILDILSCADASENVRVNPSEVENKPDINLVLVGVSFTCDAVHAQGVIAANHRLTFLRIMHMFSSSKRSGVFDTGLAHLSKRRKTTGFGDSDSDGSVSEFVNA